MNEKIMILKKTFFLLFGVFLASQAAYGSNEIRMTAPVALGVATGTWHPIEDKVSGWSDIGNPYGCSNWSPSVDTIDVGLNFVQTATDCVQARQHTVQPQEQNSKTLIVRAKGPARQESGTYLVSETQNATGTFVAWLPIANKVSTWSDVGAVYGCSNWSPATSTVDTGVSFTQTSTNCQQGQQRTVQAQEQNQRTQVIRDVGSPTIETGSYAVTQTQSAVGSSGTWLSASAVKTSWVDVGTPTNCSNWSPDPSTVTLDVSFTQTATDCQQSQQRTSQARQQNSVSLVYKNVGEPTVESGSYAVTQTQNAVGTLSTWLPIASQVSTWADVGAVYGCSNWSPATSTVDTGVTFTQTATNCQQGQQRTVQAQEQNQQTHAIRNVGAPTIESGAYAVTKTQSALGTSGTWLAASAVTTPWVNVGTPTNCINWSPDPSTVTLGVSFTQTALDCQQSQQRTSQARQQNSVSLNYQNVGSPVVQTQSIVASATRQAVGTMSGNTSVWVFNTDHVATQYGCMANVNKCTIISSSSPVGLHLRYLTLGYGSVYLGTVENIPAAKYSSIKVEMLDATGAVTRTLFDQPPSIVQIDSSYVGGPYSAAEMSAAAASSRMRLTVQTLP